MLEYHGLCAAVVATSSAFEQATQDPALSEAATDLALAMQGEPDIARLGALIAPLLAQTGPEPPELELLQRANTLWQRGLALADELNTARVEFELSIARHDLPNAVEVLQMGLDRLAALHGPVKELRDDIGALKSDIGTMTHIPPHPRQADLPVADWHWTDLFASRRGHAFVEAMRGEAGNGRGLAFAGGAIAGYAGHVAGSAWLGAVVGGPRRLHRFRDRLARDTLGVALHHTAATPDLGDLAARLRFDAHEVPALPRDLAGQLTAALASAYPGRATPDLDVAYRRMIEHLELLTGFRLPDLPAPPPIVDDPTPGGGTIETQTFGSPPDGNGTTVAVGPNTDHNSPGIASQKDPTGDACTAIIAIIVTLGIAYLIWCIGRLTDEKKCGIEDFIEALSGDPPPPESPQASQQMLETLREPGKANHILGDIYQLQLRIWQGFAAARSFLTVCGLVPPNKQELALPLFKQFLATPPAGGPWPHLEAPDAETAYADRPTTPIEDPAQPMPFPDRSWDWLLHVDAADNASTFSEVVFAVLRGAEQVNRDLDADRGYLHPAWTVAAGTSITDLPLSVVTLAYEEQ